MKALFVTNRLSAKDKMELFDFMERQHMEYRVAKGDARVILVDDNVADEIFETYPFIEIEPLQAITTLRECRDAVERHGGLTREIDFAIDYNSWSRDTLVPTGICKDKDGRILMRDSKGNVVIRNERILYAIPDYPNACITCDYTFYFIDLNNGKGEGVYPMREVLLRDAVDDWIKRCEK
jgi:hypothetical protein